jgi:two-component system, sensor histidine kinase and response regulator
MFRGGRKLFVAFVLFSCLGVVSPANSIDISETEVKIGVLAKRGVQKTFEKWNATANFLSSSLPGHHFTIVPMLFDEVPKLVGSGSVDFVIVNSAIYIELLVNYRVRRIMTLMNRMSGLKHVTQFSSAVFSNINQSKINNFTDLVGKRIVAVHPTSLGGWIMALREFNEAGVDENDFESLTFLETHDAVVQAVLSGEADVGIVRSDTLERMNGEKKIEISLIHLVEPRKDDTFPFLHSTRLYPEWPIAKLDHTSDSLARSVVSALLNMRYDGLAATAANIQGWTIPEDYQPVHEILQRMSLSPYEEFGDISLLDVVKAYRYWLIAFSVGFIVLAFIGAHVLRLNRSLTHSQEALEKNQVILVEAKGEAESANRAKSEFLASMSHDLRTPLNAIMGFSDMMREKAFGPLGNSHYEEYAGDIHDSGTLLVSLINDILDLSKIEAGKYDLDEEPLNVSSLIQISFRQLAKMAEASNQTLHFNEPRDMPALQGDERAFIQILNNLVSNAIKFTPNDGEINVRCKVDENDSIVIDVEDTGHGMSESDITRVLMPFEQASGVHARRHEGSGLGLYLCVNLMNLFGGSLEISSKINYGTVVTIRFPENRTIQFS